MAKKWIVDFSLVVSTCRTIAAETKEEAIEIADEMLSNNGGYWSGIIDSIDNDCENWRRKNCELTVIEEAPEDYEADNEEE